MNGNGIEQKSKGLEEQRAGKARTRDGCANLGIVMYWYGNDVIGMVKRGDGITRRSEGRDKQSSAKAENALFGEATQRQRVEQ